MFADQSATLVPVTPEYVFEVLRAYLAAVAERLSSPED